MKWMGVRIGRNEQDKEWSDAGMAVKVCDRFERIEKPNLKWHKKDYPCVKYTSCFD